MRISLKNIHNYLLAKGLLDASTIVNESYSVSMRSFRSTLFEVVSSDDSALCIKQLDSDHDNAPYLLQKEATALWSIWHHEELAHLRPIVPMYHGYDVSSQILITEKIVDAVNLDEYKEIEGEISVELLSNLIHNLSTIHVSQTALEGLSSINFFRKELPWIFSINDSYENGELLMPQYWPVVDYIRSYSSLWRKLNEARGTWERTSLIHGDIKWSNILISNSRPTEEFWLVDWEMADIGDPVWDLAGVYQNIICTEVFKNEESGFQLDPAWSLIKQLNEKYYASRSISSESIHIDKLIDFIVVRLLQSATEINEYQEYLLPNAQTLLDVSRHISENKEGIIKSYFD